MPSRIIFLTASRILYLSDDVHSAIFFLPFAMYLLNTIETSEESRFEVMLLLVLVGGNNTMAFSSIIGIPV